MSKHWVLLFILLISIGHTGWAATEKKHKAIKNVKHPVSTKHISPHPKKLAAKHHGKAVHKPIKQHQEEDSVSSGNSDSAITENGTLPPKTVAATTTNNTIPEPTFDTSYAIDPASWREKPEVGLSTDSTTTDTNENINTSNEALTKLAYKTVESAHYSHYKLGGTTFDDYNGIYNIDCSTYINNLLSHSNPQAFSSLVSNTRSLKPNTSDYYRFFTELPSRAEHYWHRIARINDLQPGGILVYRNTNSRGRAVSGHVMVVMSKPIPHISSSDIFQVQVADSAHSGHSNDTRLGHQSGIGIGTLLLKVDPFTGKPKAYAWRLGDHWRHNILFAMAQPIETA